MLVRILRPHRLAWILIFACTTALVVGAEPAELDQLSEEEARQVQIAERFLEILTQNPRRGTALDRVYGHHVEFGTLDALVQELDQRLQRQPQDGGGWMLLGLLESQRGSDARAADAFRQAETHRPDDPLASYYLGQSLLRIGESDEAVVAFERALDRRPARADLLEISQQLGRVHQRAQRIDQALAVWQRLETQFPDDPRVLEQIAATLAEEGALAEALTRYQRLAELVRDDYRRVMFRIQAAELTIRVGRRQEGLEQLESLLAELNPDGWLHRDVRRRIEEVFLKAADQDGLVKYYQQWLQEHPEDVDAMARLARFLASAARVPEATAWMERALQRAPSRSDLRRAFIDQLVDDQRIAEAIEQYRLLAEAAPGNADYLRDWGRLVWRDRSQDLAVRQQEAARIWRQILAARPDDALTAAQVADLFRQVELHEEAAKLYQRAVELAPAAPQYREYLGELYHHQKQPERALETWEGMAAGPRRTAANLARLAEVCHGFGYLERAIEAMAEASRMAPKDFHLQLQAAEYHARSERFEAALQYTAAAEKLAAGSEEAEAALRQRIEILQTAGQLDEEIDRLAAATRGTPAAAAEDWQLLARYFEAGRRWPEAVEASEAALQLQPQSLPALATAARVMELAGQLARAAELHRRLAAADRRSRGEHLTSVARLESQLGRSEQALEAARELILAAPGNTDYYEFYAQLCRQLGQAEEGLQALRKAVRINPNEPHLIMALGAALADQLRTDEAIEVYWRAFDKSEDVDDKTSLTLKLVPLYQQINQWEQLVERLQRLRREEAQRRAMTICLAQAYHTAGDYGTARQELESLLSEDTRDTQLLQQLAKLCQAAGDLEAAIGYLRQLSAVAPGHETEFPLVAMLQEYGERDEALEILVRLTSREDDPLRLLQSVDSLLSQGSFEAARRVVEPRLGQQRDDWELLYREGVALAGLERFEEAAHRFQRLLSLSIPHGTLGAQAAARVKRQQAQAQLRNLPITAARQDRLPLLVDMASTVRPAVGLRSPNDPMDPFAVGYSTSRSPRIWTPDSFGIARMAAYGWLLRFAQDREEQSAESAGEPETESLLDQVARRAAAADAPVEALYDRIYVAQLREDGETVFRAACRLARDGGADEREFFFQALPSRHVSPAPAAGDGAPPAKLPLADEDLALMLELFHALGDGVSGEEAAFSGGQVTYTQDGAAYVNLGGRWVQIGISLQATRLGIVYQELRLAGREREAEEILRQQLSQWQAVPELLAGMTVLIQLNKWDQLPEVYDRWASAAMQEIRRPPASGGGRSPQGTTAGSVFRGALGSVMSPWIGMLGPEEEFAQILKILDAGLDLAVAESRQQRSERELLPRRSSASSPAAVGYHSFRYGTGSIAFQLDFPRPNAYVDNNALLLLRIAYEVFQRHDAGGDLVAHLRQRAARASGDQLACEQMLLGAALWWMEEQDEAVELMSTAYRSLPDDIDLQFELITLHILREDFEDALEIVEGIAPRDQQLLQRRELTALQLAERLGDRERARQAAERLFGLRLDANTQLALAGQMRRLGLHAMADAVAARLERQGGNQPAALASLMMLYQGQGRTDEAKQLAHMLLRRTLPPTSATTASTRNPVRYSTAQNSIRRQVLQVLQQTGELTVLIRQLEEQLARSPASPRLYEQLIEYYGAANQPEQVARLLERAVAANPNSAVFRYQLAKHLEQTGKTAEACDHYLELLRLRPDWVGDELYEIRSIFQRANRLGDLVEALRGINLKLFRDRYYVASMAASLLRDDAHTDLALDLLERVFEAFPEYRNQAISQLQDSRLWRLDRVYQLGLRMLLPTAAEIERTAWSGFNSSIVYGSGGEMSLAVHSIVNGVAGTAKLADLQQKLQERVAQHPDWLGGRAMLALIDLRSNRREAGRQALAELAGDAEAISRIPHRVCWALGQELEKFPESRDTAIALLERAASPDSTDSVSQFQYSPLPRLVRLYADQGCPEQARALLLRRLKERPRDGYYSEDYVLRLRTENAQWASQRLLELEFPVDVVRLCQELLADPEQLRRAARSYSNPDDSYIKAIEQTRDRALAKIDPSSAESIAQLLTVSQTPSPGAAALDLLLVFPDVAQVGSQQLASRLADLLASVSRDPQAAAAVDRRLNELWEQYPGDLSIGILLALHRLRTAPERVAETLARLDGCIAEQPLEPLPANRRANSRQRREAALSVPLWLVARECLQRDQHLAIGGRLADRALAAARRQMGPQQTALALCDWGQLLLERGDRQGAETKWNQLLSTATERPERRSDPPAAAGDPGQSAPVATLTLSQFRLALAVATLAADSGMPELSRQAVRQALLGGLPVPDTDPSALQALRGGTFGVSAASPFTSSAPSRQSGAQIIEAEVAISLQRVLAQWQHAGYPPGEVCQLLQPLVLPPHQPAEIAMLADSSRLYDAQVASLGGELVTWSRRGERLDHLAAALDERKTEPGSAVAALVLRVLIALAAGRDEAAREPLQELARQSQAGIPLPMLELACHAALPAAGREQLQEPAFTILQSAVHQAAAARSASVYDATLLTGRLTEMVHRHLAARGQLEPLRQQIESLLAARQALYARSGDDYALVMQQRDLAQLAGQAARAGAPALALDLMGRVQDFPRSRYVPPSLAVPLALVGRELRARSPAERYQTWREWTLPTEQRRIVRLAAEFISPVAPPAALLPGASGPPLDTDLVCNLTELVSAAADAGALDELEHAARAALEQQLPNAEFLLPLVLIQQQHAEAERALLGLLETLPKRTQTQPNQSRVDLRADYVVYRASLESGRFPGLYPTLTARLQRVLQEQQQQDLLARLNFDFTCHVARASGAAMGPGDPGLVHWFPASTRNEPADRNQPWWVACDGHVVHLAGRGLDLLHFAYPLTGEFDFTVEGFEDRFANADMGFAATFIEQRPWDNATSIGSVTGHEELRRPGQMKLPDGNYNRYRVSVRDGLWRFYSNGQVVYEELLSSTSPWLTLGTFRFRVTDWQNLRFEGDPTIPREVRLLDGDCMDGWNCSFFGESQPRRRLMREPVRDEQDPVAQQQQREPTEFDWSTREGILRARAAGDRRPDEQSWIYYHRPLREGESFRYQFFYVPGRTVAHPTIGRLALVLDPAGVRTHWIAQPGWDDAFAGIPLDYEILEAPYQQTPGPLPLRKDDWNEVQVSLAGDVATISLNGAAVFQRPLEPPGDARFGLFRYKRQSSQVRHAVLSGPWPETFDEALRADLLAVHREPTAADRSFLHRVLADRFSEHDVLQVAAAARGMTEPDAYEYLKQWVLPSADRPAFRLYLRHASIADTAHSEVGLSRPQQHVAAQATASGYPQLECPAMQLVATARRTERLEELEAEIRAAEVEGVVQQRNQLALLSLIAVERGDDAAARALLAQLYRLLKEHPPQGLPPRDRTAGYVAAWQAATRSALWPTAADLAFLLREHERTPAFRDGGSEWATRVNMLVGRIEAVGRGVSEGAATTGEPLTQWRAIPYRGPAADFHGYSTSTWHFHRGSLQHLPGGVWRQLFFQSPLRGRFEILARPSTYGHREVHITYGMHAAQPRHDLKAKRIVTLMQGHRDVEQKIDLPAWDWLAEARIVVDGSRVTTYFNGVLIHKQVFAAPPDPWLVLQAERFVNPSVIYDLRILGSPEIPDELDLIDVADGGAWRADTYGETYSTSPSSNATWRRDGDELLAGLLNDRKGPPRESLLLYQRPLLEDAEIEFDTFFEPGEVEVHPAVGGRAYLLRPGGVGIHQLTGGRFEVSGRPPDNEAPLPGAAAEIPLKAKDWNRVRLAVAGDLLTLWVNDVQVAQATVTEPPEERFFGLYRDAGRTRSRIRNLVYRGQWPKALPPVDQQQLADPVGGPLRIADQTPVETITIPLNRGLDQLASQGLAHLGSADRLAVVEQGLKISLRHAESPAAWPGLAMDRPCSGECEVTLAYSGLEIRPAKQGWGVGFGLVFELDDPQQSQVECRIVRDDRGMTVAEASQQRVLPDGQWSAVGARRLSVSASAGKLRMIRRGGEIHCLQALGDSDQFQLIESIPVGDAPLRRIAVQAKSSDAAGQLDVVARQLSLRFVP